MIDVELPEELIQFGLALGLLRLETPGDLGSVTFDASFFADPAATLAGLAHDPERREAALSLAAKLFGEAARTLDLPELPEGQTWVPLAQEGPAGLFAIVDAAGNRVDLGIGGRAAISLDGLEVAATVVLPVVRADQAAGVSLLPGSPDGPVRIGVGLELPPPEDTGGVTIEGVALVADLPTAPDVEPSLAVRLRGLRLPAWPEPRDLVLTDDPDEVGRELVELLHGLLEGRASLGDDATARVRALLALLGLGEGNGIPPLPLADLLERGAAALVDWLRALVAPGTPPPLQAWLEALTELLGLDLPGGVTVDPSGRRFELRVPLDAVPDAEVAVTVDVEEAGGALTIRPGITTSLRTGTAATLPGRLRVEVELCAITLGSTPAVAWLPRLYAGFELARTGAPLVRLPATGTPVDLQVGVLRAGVLAAAGHRVALVVEAVDVIVEGTPHPRLDLSSVEAVAQAAGAAASDALIGALDEFLGAGSGRGRALAILLGLARPVPVTEPWPDLPAAAELLTDPVGALARYHARVTVGPGWGLMVAELATLVRATVPASRPAGTEADPWVVRLPGSAPSGHMELWLWREGPDSGPSLHAAVALAPDPVALAGASLRLAGLIELARTDLPVTAPAGPALSFADRAELRLHVGDNLSFTGGPVTVAATAVAAGVSWRRGRRLEGGVRIIGATVTSGGRTVALPDPFELAPGRPAAGSGQWAGLEALLGRWLAEVAGDQAGAALAGALGWLPSLRVRLAGDPGPGLDLAELAVNGWPALRLEDMLADPVGALRSWLAELLASETGPDLAHLAAGLASGLLTGRADDPVDLRAAGAGTFEHPWSVPLGADQAAPALLAWLDPDGPSLRSLDEVLTGLAPADLAGALAGAGSLPVERRLVEILRAAARFDPQLDALLAGRPRMDQALAALRAGLAGTDGLVPASAQAAEGDTRSDTVLAASHLAAPAAFDLGTHAPGTDPRRVVYLVAPLPGVAPWPGQPAGPGPQLLDLRTPGLPPEAFNLTSLLAQGPWWVLLPTRVDARGAAGVADRLRTVVRAIRARSAGPLTLVAHSVAGHAARAVWSGGDADALITVATPYGEAVPAPVAAEAVRLLRRLTAALPADTAQADLRLLLDLLATRAVVLGDAPAGADGVAQPRPFPADDLVPPPLPPAPAGADAPVAVVARLSDDDLHRALATAVDATGARVRALLPEAAANRSRAPVTHLGLGLGLGWPVPAEAGTDPGGLRAHVQVRLDAHRVRLRAGTSTRPVPQVTVRAALWRDGGWLVGAAAEPGARLRRVDLSLTAELASGELRASVVLHDAGLAGADHGRMELAGATLDAVARTLLGELARSLSPAPVAGTGRALLEVLAALGVASIDAAGTLAFDADALERLVVDPAGSLRTALGGPAAREQLVTALRALLSVALGAPLERGLGPDLHVAFDPAAGSVTVATSAAGVPLGGLVRLGGQVTFGPGTRVRALVRVGGAAPATSAGTTALVVEVDSAAATPWAVRLEVDGGRPQPVTIPLAPVLDGDALAARLLAAMAAELLRATLRWARAQPVELDPLLSALGLLLPGTPPVVRNPVWLLLDPSGWLLAPGVLGDPARPGGLSPAKLAVLADALGRLLGQTADAGRGPYPLELPGGGSLTVVPDGQGLVATAQLRHSGADGLGTDVALVVRVAPGPVVRTSVRAAVRLVGTAGFRTAGVELEAGQVVSLVVRLTPEDSSATELVLPLLPQTPGLGALTELATTGAVEHALPALLEALSSAGGDPRLAQLATALGQLGNALGIRDPATGRFRIAELRHLAADPPGELATRFRAQPTVTIAALRAMVTAVTGAVPVTGPVWSGPGGKVHADFGATATGAFELRLHAADLVPTPGLAITAQATVSDAGLSTGVLSVTVTDADAFLPGPVPLLPFVTVTLGTDLPERVEIGCWLDPPGAAERSALLIQTTLGSGPGAGTVVLYRQVAGTTTTDDADLTAAIPALVRKLAVPLAAELALGQPSVADLLDVTIGSSTVGDVLADAGVLERDPWRLADGLLDHLVGRALRAVAELIEAAGGPRLGPFQLRLLARSGAPVPAGSVRYGLGVRLPDPIEPPAVGGLILAVEADDAWDPPLPGPAGDHLELWVVELPDDPLAAGATVRATPGVRLRGLGLRVRAEQGRLLDMMVRVDSIGLHGAFAYDQDGFGFGGARLVVGGLGIDLGGAGGNPVAAKVLSPPPGEGGDAEPVAPSFSPELRVFKEGSGPVGLTLRAGLGDGPWWIAIQRSFGPVYVAQVGLDVQLAGGQPSEISLLLDGGAMLGGLAVGVDDLELIVPWATAGNPLTWRIDLAGLGIGYNNGGVTLAGGLRKLSRADGVEYVGLLVLRAAGFGLDVIGSWGEFPVAGTSDRYTSLFIFGALSATIGGPPAFFVTGLGAGVGINRGLAVPQNLDEVPRFPLVAAMSPGSTLADDPLAALNDIARAFPPARGAFWLAAGVRFTSFTVVESVAVLAVAVGDGVEIVILGTSRMGLPNPAAPLVMIELALKARFSSREGVLSIQAQLTENSWLINPLCRLSGGFAFVIWFRTGELLLTLGGYHPRFDRPAHYPTVPRLGLIWQVSDYIVVKGESYFALTSSAVMAGMRMEASFDAGFVGATFTAGVDAIVSWDPAYYDVIIYIGVSAHLQIEINLWFLGTIRIWIGFSIGAELHVWGPRLRGEAVLDLGVSRFVVPFGATEPPIGAEPLGWAAFHDKYLVAGDPSGQTMDLSVSAGQHVPDPGGPGQPDDGSAERPFKLQPEFMLTSGTRTAANRVNGQALDGLPIDLVPMKLEQVASEHTVRLLDRATGAEVPTARRPAVTPVTGQVPDALWRLPEPGDMGTDGVHAAFTGATIQAVPAAAPDPQSGTVDDVQAGPPHQLPLRDERDPAGTLSQAMAAAARWAAAQQQADPLTVAATALSGVAFPRLAERTLARCVGGRTAREAAAGPSAFAMATLPADRVAPPRLARITTGMVAPLSPPVTVQPTPPVVPVPLPEPGAPRLAALLWPCPARQSPPPGRTTVGSWGRRYPRRTPPTMPEARAGLPPLAARLHPVPPPLGPARQTLRGRDATGRFSRAGTGREWRRELLTGREPLLALEGDLPGGVRLPAGQVQVWHVPRAGADRHPQRPTLEVSGDQTVRIVALGRTGTALADQELAQGTVTVPVGTQRLAVIGTGAPPPGGAPPPRGLAGWHAGSACLRVTDAACVVPGGVLRADAALVVRNRTPVDAALVTAGEAVNGTGIVRTGLSADTRCVLVIVRVADGTAPPAEGLLLGLDGATQPLDASGTPLPPLAVTSGTRALLFFDVVPVGAAPVTVTAGHDHGWVVDGVLGAARPASLVAQEVARLGLDTLAAGLTERAPRASTLRWIGATP